MSTSRPNILFIMTDQHRYDFVGCNGYPLAQTPALDGLARGGVRFTNAFTPISLCSPARSSFVTGNYPHEHGMLSNEGNFHHMFDRLNPELPTLYSRLREAGYRTGFTGKWHMGPNEEVAAKFDYARTMSDCYAWIEQEIGRRWNLGNEAWRLEHGPDAEFCGTSELDVEHHPDVWIGRQAERFIADHARDHGDRPFYLQCWFFGPHFPIAVPPPYNTLVDPAEVAEWPNFRDTLEGKPRIQAQEKWRWNAEKIDWPQWQRIIAHSYGYVKLIDDAIGRMLAMLEAHGLADNTIVAFTADHGDNLGSHGLFNKGFNMYEETMHVPLIVRWPGTAPGGSTCERFASTLDLTETFFDAASVAHEPIHSRGLAPLLRGEAVEWPDDVYAQFHGYETTLCTQRMVRTARWKYAYNPFDLDELYDLEGDPAELTNRIDDPACGDVLEEMRTRLYNWMARVDDRQACELGYHIGPNSRVLGPEEFLRRGGSFWRHWSQM